MGKATAPVSVHLPALVQGVAPGNAMSAATTPVSVHLPALITGAAQGNAISVTDHISVSMP
jgi:hypothetical protein